jgi:hypothetical protein
MEKEEKRSGMKKREKTTGCVTYYYDYRGKGIN